MIWLIVSAIALAAMAWIVRPVFQTRDTHDPRVDKELVVYQDQLSELKRDLDLGLITAEQAEADDIEISRRVLALGDANPGITTKTTLTSKARYGTASIVSLVTVAGALGVYTSLGSPDQQNHPLEKTQVASGDHASNDMTGAIGRLAARLQKNPNDFEGWVLLARSYEFSQDFANTAKAYGRAFAIRGEDADIAGAYAEALTKAQGGIVPPTAKLLFQQLAQENPADPRNHYYIGLAHSQAGQGQEAIKVWLSLLAKSPADAPWYPAVTQQINQTATQFSIDVDALKAAMPAAMHSRAPAVAPTDMDEQARMIRSMVDRLAKRLESEPEDIDGWLRLAQAQKVLEEHSNAHQSLQNALARATTKTLQSQVQAMAEKLEIELSSS